MYTFRKKKLPTILKTEPEFITTQSTLLGPTNTIHQILCCCSCAVTCTVCETERQINERHNVVSVTVPTVSSTFLSAITYRKEVHLISCLLIRPENVYRHLNITTQCMVAKNIRQKLGIGV